MTKRFPPICSECRRFRRIRKASRPQCSHPDCKVFGPNYGPHNIFTYEARSSKGCCGPDGDLWEAPVPFWRERVDPHVWSALIAVFFIVAFWMR